MSFTTKVQKSPNKGGWHYVDMPDDLLSELRKQAGKNGNVPVVANVGMTDWKSTIMSRGQQRWYLPLSSFVREAEAIQEGQNITVSLTPDFRRLEKFKKS